MFNPLVQSTFGTVWFINWIKVKFSMPISEIIKTNVFLMQYSYFDKNASIWDNHNHYEYRNVHPLIKVVSLLIHVSNPSDAHIQKVVVYQYCKKVEQTAQRDWRPHRHVQRRIQKTIRQEEEHYECHEHDAERND